MTFFVSRLMLVLCPLGPEEICDATFLGLDVVRLTAPVCAWGRSCYVANINIIINKNRKIIQFNKELLKDALNHEEYVI